jgi:hypothetical protein
VHTALLAEHPLELHPPSKQVGVFFASHASRARVDSGHSSVRTRQKNSSSHRVFGPHASRMFAQNALHSAEPTTFAAQLDPMHPPPPSMGPPESSPPHAPTASPNTNAILRSMSPIPLLLRRRAAARLKPEPAERPD